MNVEDVIKRGSISVDDDIRLDYHITVLKLFGKDLRGHMTATYMLEDDWRVWFPKIYKNRDFVNKLANNETSFEMNQLDTSSIEAKKVFPEDETGERIIFAHCKDPVTNKKYYKFVGVFSELVGNMHHAKCQRIADTLYFDGKGRFSTKPLA